VTLERLSVINRCYSIYIVIHATGVQNNLNTFFNFF
jgi:hypothetical protein